MRSRTLKLLAGIAAIALTSPLLAAVVALLTFELMKGVGR